MQKMIKNILMVLLVVAFISDLTATSQSTNAGLFNVRPGHHCHIMRDRLRYGNCIDGYECTGMFWNNCTPIILRPNMNSCVRRYQPCHPQNWRDQYADCCNYNECTGIFYKTCTPIKDGSDY